MDIPKTPDSPVETYSPVLPIIDDILGAKFLDKLERLLTLDLSDSTLVDTVRTKILGQITRGIEGGGRRQREPERERELREVLDDMAEVIQKIREFILTARTSPEDCRRKSVKDFLELIGPVCSLYFFLEEHGLSPELCTLLEPVSRLSNAIIDADSTLHTTEDHERRPVLSDLEAWDAFNLSGKPYEAYVADVRQPRQVEADQLMQNLSTLDFLDTDAVWNWLLKISTCADLVGITIDKNRLLQAFSRNGFFLSLGADALPQQNEPDPEVFARRAIVANIRAYLDVQIGCFAPHMIKRNYQHWLDLKAAAGRVSTGQGDSVEWQ